MIDGNQSLNDVPNDALMMCRGLLIHLKLPKWVKTFYEALFHWSFIWVKLGCKAEFFFRNKIQRDSSSYFFRVEQMALTEFGFFKSIDSNRFVYWIPFFISCFWQGVTAQSTPMKKRENISCPKFGTGLNVRLRPFLAICLASYINILYKTHFEVLKESIS